VIDKKQIIQTALDVGIRHPTTEWFDDQLVELYSKAYKAGLADAGASTETPESQGAVEKPRFPQPDTVRWGESFYSLEQVMRYAQESVRYELSLLNKPAHNDQQSCYCPNCESLSKELLALKEEQQAVTKSPWKPDRSGKYLTIVYKDVEAGEEVGDLSKHPKSCALSWSHALWDVDNLKHQIG
jgi:hypothetical protein